MLFVRRGFKSHQTSASQREGPLTYLALRLFTLGGQGQLQYKVRWFGFSKEDDSWIPANDAYENTANHLWCTQANARPSVQERARTR